MKVTKYVHSCLLIETPDRAAIFDPGVMSEEALGQALDAGDIGRLDDIFITHDHGDHLSAPLIKRLVEKFPDVCITATPDAVDQLAKEGIKASATPPDGAVFFNSPHEPVRPIFDPPQEIGIHYLDIFSDPGDSHSFKETKAVLALPVQAPWGSSIDALNLAIKLKPKYVLPIHDWHWSDQAREQMYDNWFAPALKRQGIEFIKLETGQPVEIDV